MSFRVIVDGQIQKILGEDTFINPITGLTDKLIKLRVMTYQPKELWTGNRRWPRKYKSFFVTLVNPQDNLISKIHEKHFISCVGFMDIIPITIKNKQSVFAYIVKVVDYLDFKIYKDDVIYETDIKEDENFKDEVL